MATQLHWHEGLFLQPHHLQQFQRNTLAQFGTERGLVLAYPYGVIEARLSKDELENFRVRFERLELVLPGGAHISFPENADLPSLNIKQAFIDYPAGFTVYLGLPDWFDSRPNTLLEQPSAGGRIKLRYRVPVPEPEFCDENTGENPLPIQIRRYNTFMLLKEDDSSDLDRIPLLKIVHDTASEEPLPRPDPEYVYPCLHLGASPTLREMVKDVASQVSGVRDQLERNLAREEMFSQGAMPGKTLEKVMRLRSLNSFAARVPSLLDVGDGRCSLPTYSMYLELRQLLGELMALFPGKGEFDVPAFSYDHDDPYRSFSAIIKQIRNYLDPGITRKPWVVEFTPSEDGRYRRAVLEEKHFEVPTGYYLGIRTKLDVTSVTNLVQDSTKFKLMPASYETKAIRGVKLEEERFPPLELPAKMYHYRLLTAESRRIWKEVIDERTLSIQFKIDYEIPVFQMALYMTLPDEDEPAAVTDQYPDPFDL